MFENEIYKAGKKSKCLNRSRNSYVGNDREMWLLGYDSTSYDLSLPLSIESRDLRVVKTKTVCMSSIPSRVEALQKTISSLINQVDRINVALNGYLSVPDFLNHSKITTVSLDNSRGPNAKFYWVDNITGYVFICDDDIFYPSNYIERTVSYIDKYRCLISHCGIKFNDNFESYLKDSKIYSPQRQIDYDVFNPDNVGTGVLGYHAEDVSLKYNDFCYTNMSDSSIFMISRRDKIAKVVAKHNDGWIKRSSDDDGLYEMKRKDDSHASLITKQILSTYKRPIFKDGVTVILYNYKRTNNLHRIISDLKKQEEIPVYIYVWNNNPEPFHSDQVDWIINSNRNVHTQSCSYMVDNVETEFVCRMDDDLTPNDSLLFRDLISSVNTYPIDSRIFGMTGVRLADNKCYSNGSHVGPSCKYHFNDIDVPVDIIKGRFFLFRNEFSHLLNRKYEHAHMDIDISFLMAQKRRMYHIVPKVLHGRLFNLEEKYDDGTGAGYSSMSGHLEFRNKITREWLHDIRN